MIELLQHIGQQFALFAFVVVTIGICCAIAAPAESRDRTVAKRETE